MFKTIWEDIKASVNKFKSLFGPVGSIIEARLTALVGVITAGVGLMDWSPLTNLFGMSTEFNKTQVIALGAITFVKGIISEVTRRTNDPMLKVTQAVDAAPEVAKAKKKIKKVIAKTPEVPVQ